MTVNVDTHMKSLTAAFALSIFNNVVVIVIIVVSDVRLLSYEICRTELGFVRFV